MQFFVGVKLGLWHLIEEHRLRVSENRLLRKIFENKGDEIIGDCRKL
jgi:hypothetical protein